MAMIKTHYYGGIKKYQWTAIPLTLSGTVIKKDGTRLDISLGGEGDDFCFTITDILIHLASEQMKKTMSEGVEGEALNVLAGGIPHFEENEESVKKAVLLLLREKYGIEEEELLTSELEFAPAFRRRTSALTRALSAHTHRTTGSAHTRRFRRSFPSRTRKRRRSAFLSIKRR